MSVDLTQEILRDIQRRLSNIEDGQVRMEHRLGTIEHHLGGLLQSTAYERGEVDALRRRVERLERRANIIDDVQP
jgi:polyhydroxyalkanoate synthesis regulator phasin